MFAKRFLLFKKAPPAALQELPMKTNVRVEYTMLWIALLLFVLFAGFVLKALTA